MKVLITGKNSYIGSSVKAYIEKQDPSITISEISLRNIDINLIDFSSYDVVFHVAGIAHISQDKKLDQNYFEINRDLAISVAKKAKVQGVKSFIFTSSMAIYGEDSPIGKYEPLYENIYKPKEAYGKSKLEADLAIQNLESLLFKPIILRLPMVYGPNSKGNFPKLEKFANKLFVIPNNQNKRSVLHIDNLSALVYLLIKKPLSGVYFPQDTLLFNTTQFIQEYRQSKNKKTIKLSILNPLVTLLSYFFKVINKVYGNKFYDSKISIIKNYPYQLKTWRDYIHHG
jgi:nucleoside-diphosphate-sugar epimerase